MQWPKLFVFTKHVSKNKPYPVLDMPDDRTGRSEQQQRSIPRCMWLIRLRKWERTVRPVMVFYKSCSSCLGLCVSAADCSQK